jgi:hypothetical protein
MLLSAFAVIGRSDPMPMVHRRVDHVESNEASTVGCAERQADELPQPGEPPQFVSRSGCAAASRLALSSILSNFGRTLQ